MRGLWGTAVLLASISGCDTKEPATGPTLPSPGASAEPIGKAEAALQGFPESVTGYEGCDKPWCTDLARACDDIVRSGCGGPYLPAGEWPPPGGAGGGAGTGHGGGHERCRGKGHLIGQGKGHDADNCEGNDSGPPRGSDPYRRAMVRCLSAATGTIIDSLMERFEEELEEKDLPEQEEEEAMERAPYFFAREIATCTRRAHSCTARFDCSRGTMTPPGFPVDNVGSHGPGILPPEPEAPKPWANEGSEAPVPVSPWSGGKIRGMAAVDSPACVRCAVQRCPTVARQCYDSQTEALCPGGDCCQSLRTCIQACGGYKPGAPFEEFSACLYTCGTTRPTAVTQLLTLGQCVRNECAGCGDFDRRQAITSPVPSGVAASVP